MTWVDVISHYLGHSAPAIPMEQHHPQPQCLVVLGDLPLGRNVEPGGAWGSAALMECAARCLDGEHLG